MKFSTITTAGICLIGFSSVLEAAYAGSFSVNPVSENIHVQNYCDANRTIRILRNGDVVASQKDFASMADCKHKAARMMGQLISAKQHHDDLTVKFSGDKNEYIWLETKTSASGLVFETSIPAYEYGISSGCLTRPWRVSLVAHVHDKEKIKKVINGKSALVDGASDKTLTYTIASQTAFNDTNDCLSKAAQMQQILDKAKSNKAPFAVTTSGEDNQYFMLNEAPASPIVYVDESSKLPTAKPESPETSKHDSAPSK